MYPSPGLKQNPAFSFDHGVEFIHAPQIYNDHFNYICIHLSRFGWTLRATYTWRFALGIARIYAWASSISWITDKLATVDHVDHMWR